MESASLRHSDAGGAGPSPLIPEVTCLGVNAYVRRVSIASRTVLSSSRAS